LNDRIKQVRFLFLDQTFAEWQTAAELQLAGEFGTAPVSRVRLCLVGRERVGKTTLALTLLRKWRFFDRRTMGIDIENVTLNSKDFSLWDFAGDVSTMQICMFCF
jgi:GTPase SAR1 family protein